MARFPRALALPRPAREHAASDAPLARRPRARRLGFGRTARGRRGRTSRDICRRRGPDRRCCTPGAGARLPDGGAGSGYACASRTADGCAASSSPRGPAHRSMWAPAAISPLWSAALDRLRRGTVSATLLVRGYGLGGAVGESHVLLQPRTTGGSGGGPRALLYGARATRSAPRGQLQPPFRPRHHRGQRRRFRTRVTRLYE